MPDRSNLTRRGEVIPPVPRLEFNYEPEMRPPAEIDLRETLHRLVLNKTLILLCGAAGVAAAVFVTERAIPSYQAEASIRIEEKPSFLGGTRGLTTQGDAAGELSTEREVLHSRALAEDVADSLNLNLRLVEPRRTRLSSLLSGIAVDPDAPVGAYEFERESPTSFMASFVPAAALTGGTRQKMRVTVGDYVLLNGIGFMLRPQAASHSHITLSVVPPNVAAEEVRSATTILQPVRDASIIVVRYKGPDPELARAIPNTLARRFIARRQNIQKTESRNAVRFLREQLDSLGPQLARAEDSLRIFRESQTIVSLETEGSAQVGRLASLQARYADIEGERAGLTELLTEVQQQDAQRSPEAPSPYRRLLAFPTLLGNGAAAGVLGSLTSADDQRLTLLMRRTPRDPDVIMLTQHIKEIEDRVKDLALTYIRGLTIETNQLHDEIARFGTKMQAVPAKEVTYARLQRRPKMLDGIYTLLQSRLKEAQIDEGIEDASVQMLDSALVPTSPVSPKPAMNVGIGLTLGLVLGLALAFFRDQLDNSVHTREQLKRVTSVPVLALIPRIQPSAGRGMIGAVAGQLEAMPERLNSLLHPGTAHGPSPKRSRLLQIGAGDRVPFGQKKSPLGHDVASPVSEAYRRLRTNITFAYADDPPRTLVFTSPLPQDGKTTSAVNLAITLTQQGLKVLLVDADMRRGLLHKVFGVKQQPGLSGVLAGTDSWHSAISKIDLHGTGTLDVLPTGPIPVNPAELLGSSAMGEFISLAKEEYDMVLFDSPPLNLVTDAAVLGTMANGVVLVARAGKSTDDAMRFAMEQLRHVGAPVIGTLLNAIDFSRDSRYYGSVGAYGYAYNSQR